MVMAMKQRPPHPRPRRLASHCHRHPDTLATTGLCPFCLRERLSLLDPSAADDDGASTSISTSAGALPELRRCKSYSANNCEDVVGMSLEPRRRSCDVRARSSLSNLFEVDEDGGNSLDTSETLPAESENLGFLRKGTCPVPEVREEEEEENEGHSDFEVARVSDFPILDEFEESKTMKEFIDLEFQPKTKSTNRKDFKEIAGSFWVTASVFSKKLRKWKKKQVSTREQVGAECCSNADSHKIGLGEMQLEKLRGRRLRFRDSQSEVGEYGFGRRSCDVDPRGSLDLGRASIDGCAFGRISCDTDPRFSIDLGRASIDCGRISVDKEARCSFDAPRASWDGYMMGAGMTMSRVSPPVVSVIENAMATVYGFDHQMLAREATKVVENKDERENRRSKPMKDYYLDAASLLMRRKSFDQSDSLKKDMAMKEINGDEKPLSKARVSTSATIGIFDGAKLLITEKELNEWRLNSIEDDSSESFDTASKDLTSVSSSSTDKDFKKNRQWSKLWTTWGLLHRKKSDKHGKEEKLDYGNVELPQAISADNSSRNDNAEIGSNPDWKLLDRNPSVKNSSNRLDNGLLKFYLTPSGNRRRNKLEKVRLKKSHSLARSVLKL